MIVDLQRLQSVRVDNGTGIATVGGGARLGNIATAIYSQGQRSLPHGICPNVGIGGHFTHGGYGYDSRLWGLALDSIVSLDVVLANGSFVHTSETQYPDVYYALRGAADSFGIVTTFHLQTIPAPRFVLYFDVGIPLAIRNVRTITNGFLQLQETVMVGVGSQINVPPSNSSAYPDRDALWVLQNYGDIINDQPSYIDATTPSIDNLTNSTSNVKPDDDLTAYLNYIDPDLTTEETKYLYYEKDNYAKPLKLKLEYDPNCTFWNPQAMGMDVCRPGAGRQFNQIGNIPVSTAASYKRTHGWCSILFSLSYIGALLYFVAEFAFEYSTFLSLGFQWFATFLIFIGRDFNISNSML